MSVGKVIGQSASGTTKKFVKFLKAQHKTGSVTIFPRTMGYLIADALLKGRRGSIASLLVHYHKTGRMKAMASANWRP